jgi:hypothetical protein
MTSKCYPLSRKDEEDLPVLVVPWEYGHPVLRRRTGSLAHHEVVLMLIILFPSSSSSSSQLVMDSIVFQVWLIAVVRSRL